MSSSTPRPVVGAQDAGQAPVSIDTSSGQAQYLSCSVGDEMFAIGILDFDVGAPFFDSELSATAGMSQHEVRSK